MVQSSRFHAGIKINFYKILSLISYMLKKMDASHILFQLFQHRGTRKPSRALRLSVSLQKSPSNLGVGN